MRDVFFGKIEVLFQNSQYFNEYFLKRIDKKFAKINVRWPDLRKTKVLKRKFF
jgi:hypothetical protein